MSREILEMSHGSLLNFLPSTKHFNFVIVVQSKTYLVGIIRYWGKHSNQLSVYYFLWIALYI